MDKKEKQTQEMERAWEVLSAFLGMNQKKPLVQGYVPISNLGEAIKSARKVQGLTQIELANLANLSLSTIVQIEKGNKKVSFENIERVLKSVGKTLWIK